MSESTSQKRAEELKPLSDDWFREAFTDPVTRMFYVIPQDLEKTAKRLCLAYNIRGICDPMYIVNIIAVETGRGDGKSTFFKKRGDR